MPLEAKFFIVCAALQMFFYLFFFLRLNFERGFSSLPEFSPPVSVIICAKNEASALKQYLKIVLIQQYPVFEVIVVNDESTDHSIDVLVEYYKRNKNLKIINIDSGTSKDFAGKKFALQKGIEAASYETIVVTDADCRPATTHWLSKLVGSYLQNTNFVLGYSPYERQDGFLNKVIRYENFISSLLCFGFAKAGIPYMGVGRNLSYKKNVFAINDTFTSHKHLPTGDDDLFVNRNATRGNTEICLDKDAYVFTAPKTTVYEWLLQKKRHLRAGFHYKIHHSFLLLLFSVSLFGLYLSLIILCATSGISALVLYTLCALILIKLIISFRLFKRLTYDDLKLLSPVLDVFYTAYLITIFFLLLLQPKDKWK